MITPEDFLAVVSPEKKEKLFRLGTIPPDYVDGDPKIIFDGETTAANITYKCVSYTPVAGERVLLGMVGSSWVVLGGIGAAGGGGGTYHFSISEPTAQDGADGDVWFVYTP